MKLQELYKPKVEKRIASAAKEYVQQKRLDLPTVNAQFNLQEKLAKIGWKRAKDGGYSTVYINPAKSYVIKINDRQDGGYMQYVRIMHKYKNKHFPIISDIKRLPLGLENVYFVYLIEKLEEIDCTGEVLRTMDECQKLVRKIAHNNYTVEEVYGNDLPDCFKKDPALLKACVILGKNVGCRFIDMHWGNFMKRSNGTLIITDPYS